MNGKEAIPLRVALEQLGLDNGWDTSDTLSVRSSIKKIEVMDGKISIDAPVPVQPKVSIFDSPTRVVIDLKGAYLPPSATLILGPGSRAAQFQPDTVRVVLETKFFPNAPKTLLSATKSISLDVNPIPGQVVQPPSEEQDPTAPDPDQQPEQDPASLPPAQPGVANLTLGQETDKGLLLTLSDFGVLTSPLTFRKPDPSVLEIVLPGATFQLPEGFHLDTDSVKDVALRQEDTALVLSLTLARPMGVEVWKENNAFQIQLYKPQIGNGKLAGKIIVVDAGHGGHDSGAKSPKGDAYEKNLTLAISKLLSQKLAAEGATVIMTRKSDVFIPLKERSNIATRNKADLFVSVHINANNPNSSSGGITFYHKGNAISKVLAECLQKEIAQVSGIPNLGVWSDGKIYQSGFSVLRNATMPAVLIECGFIDHDKDRKRMKTSDFQNSIAEAIVQGLKVYLGNGD